MSFSARYLPGSAEAEIGGDWYDAIPLRDGKAGVAIGDVVGRGIGAAARMAHLQSAVRAYALEGLRPSVVLERTDAFAQELERRGMATMLYAVLDPEAGTLRFASAGHPPPLILTPGGRGRLRRGPLGQPAGHRHLPVLRGERGRARAGLGRPALHGRPRRAPHRAALRRARRPGRGRRRHGRPGRALPLAAGSGARGPLRATTSHCSRSASSRCPPSASSSRSPPSRARSRRFAGSSGAG